MDAVLFACVHNAQTVADGRRVVQQNLRSHQSVWLLCGHRARRARSPRGRPGNEGRGHRPGEHESTISTELAQKATLLVTMGCGDACRYVPGLRKLDWPLRDPKGQPIEIVRQIRDEVRARVTALAEERGWL
jgi:arsenate reductase